MTFHHFQPFIAQNVMQQHRTSITTFYNINGTVTVNYSWVPSAEMSNKWSSIQQ